MRSPNPPDAKPNLMLIVSLVGGAVVLALGALFVFKTGSTSDHRLPLGNSEASSYVSVADVRPCPRPPTLSVESVDTGPDGLRIRSAISSACPDGDLLSNSGFRISAVDAAGHDVASGIFDLEKQPIAVGPSGASVAFTFPSNSYWRPPNAIAGDVRLTGRNEGTERSTVGDVQSVSSVTAVAPGAPDSGNLDAAAQSALVDIAAADRNVLDAGLLDRWQPQLSSKRPGLFADGINWSMPDIVREHLALRQRFPDARLVWSGDWPVYGDPTWWVTLAGVPFDSGVDANIWCSNNGFDPDHCFAKMLSHDRGTSGTTLGRK